MGLKVSAQDLITLISIIVLVHIFRYLGEPVYCYCLLGVLCFLSVSCLKIAIVKLFKILPVLAVAIDKFAWRTGVRAGLGKEIHLTLDEGRLRETLRPAVTPRTRILILIDESRYNCHLIIALPFRLPA